jgi:hypothetical protein
VKKYIPTENMAIIDINIATYFLVLPEVDKTKLSIWYSLSEYPKYPENKKHTGISIIVN